MNTEKITTEVRRRKKPHERFAAKILFDSDPTELLIEADRTSVNVRDLTPNPEKFSLGKIVGGNGNSLEFFMYPLDSLDQIYAGFVRNISAKGTIISIDKRNEREFWNLLNRIRYYRSLSRERRWKFLRSKGFTANINIT